MRQGWLQNFCAVRNHSVCMGGTSGSIRQCFGYLELGVGWRSPLFLKHIKACILRTLKNSAAAFKAMLSAAPVKYSEICHARSRFIQKV